MAPAKRNQVGSPKEYENNAWKYIRLADSDPATAKNTADEYGPWIKHGGKLKRNFYPADTMLAETDTPSLTKEVAKRYPGQDLYTLGETLKQEMHLPKELPIERALQRELPANPIALSGFDQSTRNVRLGPEGRDPGTLYHELTHAADRQHEDFIGANDPTKSAKFMAAPTPFYHFKHYEGSQDKDMGMQVGEQNRVEKGFPPDVQTQALFPWLSKVRPLSSNKLAIPPAYDNPWTASQNFWPEKK